jgi:hypothetical protein
MRFYPAAQCFLVFVFASLSAGAEVPSGEGLHRLYDLAPASEQNLVVARVAACGIEIPISELRGYILSLPHEGRRPASTLAEKNDHLQQLLDDHFLLWDGYQKKADQTPELVRLLKNTETMLLGSALLQQEVIEKAKTGEDYQRLTQELEDRVFERADVAVSNEAYAELKAAAKPASGAESAAPDFRTMPPDVRNRPLAKCPAGIITIGDVVAATMRMPAERRPDLAQRPGVIAVIKKVLAPVLIADEARARGLGKSPMVVEKMQMNRNALTRMYALDRITDQAVARLKEPGAKERLQQWFQRHLKDRYARKNAEGKDEVIDLEKEHEAVENDYFDFLRDEVRAEKIRALREGKAIEIDEPLLERTPL